MTTDIIEHNQADTKAAIFSPNSLAKLQQFASVMAQSRVTVPSHLAGKEADCLAVALQAAQWGMNPYAVAQKTHVVNGTLGYEAQLVNAVITSSTAVKSRFKYEYSGPWEKFRPGDKNPNAEKGLCVRVGAVLAGEDAVTWGEWLYLEFITTRNSPLWKTAPKQQLAYLAVKYWARLYTPDVILGVYTPDELDREKRSERDVTPQSESPRSIQDLNSMINASQRTDSPPEPHSESNDTESNEHQRSAQELFEGFNEAANNAESLEELDRCFRYAAHKLANDSDLLSRATDVYAIRKDELAE